MEKAEFSLHISKWENNLFWLKGFFSCMMKDKYHLNCVINNTITTISVDKNSWDTYELQQIGPYTIRSHDIKSHMLVSKLHSGTSLKGHCDEIFRIHCFCIFWIFKWYLLTCPGRFVQQAREDVFFHAFSREFFVRHYLTIRPCCFVTSYS